MEQFKQMYKFDVEKVTKNLIQWIQDWFEENGKGCNAVIGISGGKDSTISAALCVAALGKDRVIGIRMPNGRQYDIDDAIKVCEYLGIQSYEHNIQEIEAAVYNSVPDSSHILLSKQSRINLPARIRMTVLYFYSQSLNGRVVNNCNLSENWVGYSTRYGDAAGDFALLQNLTVTEIKQIGHYLGLPADLVDKTPSDGLCGSTDEDAFGFTYDELDKYIREGIEPEKTKKDRIDYLHKINQFKLKLIPKFDPNIPIMITD